MIKKILNYFFGPKYKEGDILYLKDDYDPILEESTLNIKIIKVGKSKYKYSYFDKRTGLFFNDSRSWIYTINSFSYIESMYRK